MRAILALSVILLNAIPGVEGLAQQQPSLDRIAARVVKHVNHQRAMNGVPPVRLERRLTQAAQAHAEDMARRDYLDHVAPDGGRLENRLVSAGYPWRAVAENVSAGRASPEITVDNWMISPGHRDNMLGSEYQHVGVGYARPDPNGKRTRYRHYWTVIFAAPAR